MATWTEGWDDMQDHVHICHLPESEGLNTFRYRFMGACLQVLRLSQVTLGRISTGHVVNLTSNDVQRFDLAFMRLHFLWISPLLLTLFTYLVYQEVGWPAFPAAGLVILQVPLQILLASVFGRMR